MQMQTCNEIICTVQINDTRHSYSCGANAHAHALAYTHSYLRSFERVCTLAHVNKQIFTCICILVIAN